MNIGPMSSKTGDANDAKLRALMVQGRHARRWPRSRSEMATTLAGRRADQGRRSRQKSVAGFYVDGTLNDADGEDQRIQRHDHL